MTIAACYLSPEGVVLGADSAASFQTADGFHFFNHAQKVFEIGENATWGIIVWGLGGLQESSHRGMVAELGDTFLTDPPNNVTEATTRWIDLFWARYTTEQAASIARAQALHSKAPHQPSVADPGQRTEDEEKELAQLYAGLSVGFCIGGYALPSRAPGAASVTFEPLKGKPTPQPVLMDGYGFWGAPNMVSRLLHGSDVGLRDAILASGKWAGTEGDLDGILNRFVYGGLRLPIRDAIDFVHSYIFSTIKAFKFSSMSQICGGPIELAVIRNDRPFQWVRHKPWHAALDEGMIQ